MIKFSHPEWEHHIKIKAGFLNTIVIENPEKLYKYLSELIAQADGGESRFMLSQDNEDISISKQCEVISNMLNIDLNGKKSLNLLHKKICKMAETSEKLFDVEKVMFSLKDSFCELLYEIDMPLETKEEVDIASVIKLFDVKFPNNFKNLTCKIISYINMLIELKNIKVLFFICAKSYLSSDSLKEIIKHCEYNDVRVVFFENYYASNVLENEQVFIIDNDLCELFVNQINS